MKQIYKNNDDEGGGVGDLNDFSKQLKNLAAIRRGYFFFGVSCMIRSVLSIN